MVCTLAAFAQGGRQQLSLPNSFDSILAQIQNDQAIDADSAYRLVANWSHYPGLKQTAYDYIFFYNDPTYGKIPLHVYIPATYKSKRKNPCVLLLHGAVSRSHFSDINSTGADDDDVLFDILKARNYIVIRPIADAGKEFDWVKSKFETGDNYSINHTFQVLSDVIVSLKKVLNIDDAKVFAMGHSDGSDGAVGLGVYSPDAFAGVIAYNSMFNNLFARDFYVRNIQNRPMYVVHSSLDNLRPIKMTRTIIDSLLKFDSNILYKEYTGYNHYDKHLDKDLPSACEFMKGISRNPFQARVNWETAHSEIYNGCDWLKITGINKAMPNATWHAPFNITASFARQNKVVEYPYYARPDKSTIAKATCNNNVFTILASRVTEIELLISPVMINLENPVVVIVNGKQVYNQKIKADKDFILNNFKKSGDRDAVWVNSIRLKVE